jgi:hypothetical protein
MDTEELPFCVRELGITLGFEMNISIAITANTTTSEMMEIMRAQADARNPIWMASIVRRDIGKDASLMVADIHRYESTGQKRDNTWGKKGNKEAIRRMENTMGYQILQ